MNSYAGKSIGFEGSCTNTGYTTRNSYAGKIIVIEGITTNPRYTIRNNYAGKVIIRVFTTDYYSIFYR